MSINYIHKKVEVGTILAHGGLSQEDQQACELLVLQCLKKRLPAGCTQVAIRVEVDLFIETLVLLGEWKTEVPVTVEAPSAEGTVKMEVKKTPVEELKNG